jgi:response regulator RpfG family c-di-GMP phosphodiesterase
MQILGWIFAALLAVLLGTGKLLSTRKEKTLEMQLDLQTKKTQTVKAELAQNKADLQSAQSLAQATEQMQGREKAVDQINKTLEDLAQTIGTKTEETNHTATIRIQRATDKVAQIKEELGDEQELPQPLQDQAAEAMAGFFNRRHGTGN